MSNKKETPVSWLVKEIEEKFNFRFASFYGQEIQQALEISKWQQEQDKNKYSEEDMIAFGWFCREKSLTMVELLIDKFKN
jgi:hypothetical protein